MTSKILLSVVEFYGAAGEGNAWFLVPAINGEPEKLLYSEQYEKWVKEYEEHAEISKTILFGMSPQEYMRWRLPETAFQQYKYVEVKKQ